MKSLKLIPTAKLSEAEWQSLRQSFVNQGMIGGSDAGTLLGLNQYKSAINLFYQAVGVSNLPNKMNSAMLHGKQLEDYVAKCWQYYDGTEEGWVENTLADNKIKKYRKLRSIVVNPKYPMLFANVDGVIIKHPQYKKKGVLEIKTISGYAADNYEGGLPPSYLLQLQHYMLVLGLEWGEICYLVDGRKLGCVTFEADKELQERILDAATDFYKRVNAAKIDIVHDAKTPDEAIAVASAYEPAADHTQAFNQFISEKHKSRENEVTMQGSDEHEQWAYMYNNVSSEIKILENDKQLYQNRLKQAMEKEGATIMELPNGKVTWRKQFSVRI